MQSCPDAFNSPRHSLMAPFTTRRSRGGEEEEQRSLPYRQAKQHVTRQKTEIGLR